MNLKTNEIRWTAAVALAALVALAATACKDSTDEARDSFYQEMIPHHQAAVAMADVALQRSERPEIRQVAQEIKREQDREIQLMRERLGNKANGMPAAHGGMQSGGMDMGTDQATIDRLKTAEPFDRAFIDAMVPHHEAAIQSARQVKEKSKDKQVNELADAIIAAQEREIAQMREWRRQWYGS